MRWLLGLLLISSTAWSAPSSLDSDQEELLKTYGVGQAKDQAYCYLKDQAVAGHRVNERQRIASVTKLFTTLLVSETLDLKKTYKTVIHVGKDQLHIEGGLDPYFEEDKLLLLMQALNRLGYKKFKRVTFDQRFLFTDVAQEEHRVLGPQHVKERLTFFLSGRNPKSIKALWSKVQTFAKEEGVDLDPTLPALLATSVLYSATNPLKENAIRFVHESRPLHRLLKAMNVMSKNMVAQNLFIEASKVRSMGQMLTAKGIAATTYQFYNGSGLPLKKGTRRWDNTSTCTTVLTAIAALEDSLQGQGFGPTEILAVSGGLDLGSFRNRFTEYPEAANAVISKTGTVNFTSSLAGLLLLESEVPFAILNHTDDVSAARKFQDAFVVRMFHHLGEPVPTPYTKIPTFPWEGDDFLVQAEND